MRPPRPGALSEWFGAIDIYLFDQLLRGRITPRMRILDAGCGAGRNLVYFLRTGFDVHGVDADPEAIEAARRVAAQLAPGLGPGRFQVADITELPFEHGSFDLVIASAVLHFARSREHFEQMVDELWRVLAPSGLFWARLASTEGLGPGYRPGTVGTLPSGEERFFVDADLLTRETERLCGTLADPLRTLVLHGQRSMATWTVRKPEA